MCHCLLCDYMLLVIAFELHSLIRVSGPSGHSVDQSVVT